MKIVLEIPGEATPSQNIRGFHSWKRTMGLQKHWDKLVREALEVWLYALPEGKDSLPVALLRERTEAFRPTGKRRVTVIRQSPRELEWMNFIGGLKAPTDALRLRKSRKDGGYRGNHLILDDSNALMENGPHEQRKGAAHTTIIIEDI